MKLLRVMQTGRPVTALQYHRSSDCLLYSSLEHGVISGAPLGTGSFPDLEAPGRPEGIYHFALDPSQQIIAVSTRKNQGLLYHLSDQRWQSLNLLLQDEMEPDSRSADSCPMASTRRSFRCVSVRYASPVSRFRPPSVWISPRKNRCR